MDLFQAVSTAGVIHFACQDIIVHYYIPVGQYYYLMTLFFIHVNSVKLYKGEFTVRKKEIIKHECTQRTWTLTFGGLSCGGRCTKIFYLSKNSNTTDIPLHSKSYLSNSANVLASKYT